jgi:hypothetical protein
MWEALVEKKHQYQAKILEQVMLPRKATGRINIISKGPRNHEHCKAAIHRG